MTDTKDTETGSPAGGGSNGAPDLASQIAAAAPGAVIQLGPGELRLDCCIAVDRDLTLRGAGADSTVIRGSSDDDWIRVAAGATLRLERIAVVRQGQHVAADAIVVDGALAADQCRIEGATTADGSGGAGVRARNSARVDLTDTRVLHCEFAAIIACDDSQVCVRRSELEGGAQGAAAWGKARIEIHDTRATGHTACGVEMLQAAHLVLSGCQCQGAMAGVGLSGTVEATLSGNELHSEQHGLSVSGSSRATLRGDRAEACGDCGLFAREKAQVKAERFTSKDCVRWGVCALGDVQIDLEEPAIIGTRQRGLSARGRARVRLKGGEVVENAMGGIHGEDRPKIEIIGTTCSRNGGPGIEATDRVALLVREAVFADNAGGAITIGETVELSHAGVTFERNGGGDVVRVALAAAVKAKPSAKKSASRKGRS